MDTSKRHIGVGGFETTDRMRALLEEVLSSGRISYGPMCVRFEQEFAQLHGCEHAILSNSGTSSLQVALQALKEENGWEDGDEVLVPATTFVATSNIVLHNRMVPVFVDVELDTLNMNPALIEWKITPRTRAIIPVHLCGRPANMPEIMRIARAHGLGVIEDSCECMFVKVGGQPVGSWGDVGCFSTYVAHLITTGVGGLCTTRSASLAARIRSLVNHGLAFEYLNPDANFQPRPMGNRRFLFDTVGHSFRLTEFEAALGLAQLEDYKSNLMARLRNAKHLTAGLKIINKHRGDPFDLRIGAKSEDYGGDHAWMIYPILLSVGAASRWAFTHYSGSFPEKEPLMTWLNENGIETRDLMPLLGQPAEPYASLDQYAFMTSRYIWRCGFYVGCHQYLTPDDIQHMVGVIDRYFERFR